MSKVVIGYLTYITEKNRKNRLSDFLESLESLKNLKSNRVDLITIDNNSIEEVRSVLRSSEIFNKFFHYEKNHYDISLFYTSAWYALNTSAEYVCFMYDDFIVYDNAIEDVLDFMDSHPEVTCTRITEYDFNNKKKYDSDTTPKYVNPDAIRHYNTVTEQKLTWQGPFTHGNHEFYINNWHYTSRPIVWRVTSFLHVLQQHEEHVNVLQGFEKWAMPAFNEAGIVTGVLDKGMVRTTPVSKSARVLEFSLETEKSIKIPLADLKSDYEMCIKV